jgi:hypothetical protein
VVVGIVIKVVAVVVSTKMGKSSCKKLSSILWTENDAGVLN